MPVLLCILPGAAGLTLNLSDQHNSTTQRPEEGPSLRALLVGRDWSRPIPRARVPASEPGTPQVLRRWNGTGPDTPSPCPDASGRTGTGWGLTDQTSLPGPAQLPQRPQAATGRDRPRSAPPDPNASGPAGPEPGSGPVSPSGPRPPGSESGPAQAPRTRTPTARSPLTAAPGSPAPARPVSAGA